MGAGVDNDEYVAFKETGDVFDPETAELCRKFIYAAGNVRPPQELFKSFRGREEPDIGTYWRTGVWRERLNVVGIRVYVLEVKE